MMNDPRHQRVRRLVSHGFTPRMIARLRADFEARTAGLVEEIARRGECDLVTDVAGELPLQAICFLLGVPEADRHQLFEWIEHSFDFRGRGAFESTPEVSDAMLAMHTYAAQLIAAKRAKPGDDMLSLVVHAELPDVEPAQLTAEELHMFFALLFAAGADTIRNAAAGGLLALIEQPDAFTRARTDPALMPTLIEETVRWTSPARTTDEPQPGTFSLTVAVSAPATRSCSGRRRPTETSACSRTR